MRPDWESSPPPFGVQRMLQRPEPPSQGCFNRLQCTILWHQGCSRCPATITTIQTLSFPNRRLVLVKDEPPPWAPGVHRFAFCLHEFHSSRAPLMFSLFLSTIQTHLPIPRSIYQPSSNGSGTACRQEEQELVLIYRLMSINKSSPAQVTTIKIISGV